MTEMQKMNNDVDAHVDDEIYSCLSLEKPKSFFLFAGAGSGKTRSLVTNVDRFVRENERLLRAKAQRIGIITYTNAACDEITGRLNFSPLVEVSTIHSFVWKLIEGFNTDIRKWLADNLLLEISELETQQLKGRAGKASLDREKSIQNKRKRLENLPSITKFTYNPNGDNVGKDSLNHSEVIKIGSYFLENKALMQRILISKFPILLVDESQDTNKHLMNAFFEVQRVHATTFALGLLGDTMQRIYSDGKVDLGQNLPDDWATPAKAMNHRCPKRVVRLINKIRSSVDDQTQTPRTDSIEGTVRLFAAKISQMPKVDVEDSARTVMAGLTDDVLWAGPDAQVKALILEHHMAALRMGFGDMYEALSKIERFRTGLLDGSLPAIRLFSSLILPLLAAKRAKDEFTASSIVRKSSPLLSKEAFKSAGSDQSIQIKRAREAVDSLFSLWSEEKKPSFLDVLRNVSASGLFPIPEVLKPIAARTVIEQAGADQEMAEVDLDESEVANLISDALDAFLRSSFSQIAYYDAYVTGNAEFDTHQGVKGREFPRVMVVIDDDGARGFLFQYEKLFGVKDKSATDLKHENDGEETGIDRTRRLFYVTCSRAEKSLAIVVHTESPEKLRDFVLAQGWFEKDEVVLL